MPILPHTHLDESTDYTPYCVSSVGFQSVLKSFRSVISSQLISPFNFDPQHLAECLEYNRPIMLLSD